MAIKGEFYSGDNDYLNYYPLKDGTIPSSSPILKRFSSIPEKNREIFQWCPSTKEFLGNKKKFRDKEEHYHLRYYRDIYPILKFIENNIPSNIIRNEFDEDHYDDYLDYLCDFITEDVVIIHYDHENKTDYVSHAHLCSPSDWSSQGVVGKSFEEIHRNVRRADGKLVINNPTKIVEGMLKMSETHERVGAITFRSHCKVNRHPNYTKPDVWHWGPDQEFYLRFERQTLTAFPQISSILFTIKTYYNDLTAPNRIDAAISALEAGNENAYDKKFLATERENAIKFLRQKEKMYENILEVNSDIVPDSWNSR